MHRCQKKRSEEQGSHKSRQGSQKIKRRSSRVCAVACLLAVILLFGLLTGCATVPEVLSVPAIQEVSLTDSEKTLLQAVGVERCFVFDVRLDQLPSEKVAFQVQVYEGGELVNTVMDLGMSGFLEKNTQRLIWSQMGAGKPGEEVWGVSFAGGSHKVHHENHQEVMGWSWTQMDRMTDVTPGEPVMLAAVVGTRSGSMRSPGAIFGGEEVEVDNPLALYDVAYVLTATFE